MIDDKYLLAFVVMAVNTKSLKLGMYISSCAEIEQKKKYKIPINIACDPKLTRMDIAQIFDVTADKIRV
jgi:hypothetical protein